MSTDTPALSAAISIIGSAAAFIMNDRRQAGESCEFSDACDEALKALVARDPSLDAEAIKGLIALLNGAEVDDFIRECHQSVENGGIKMIVRRDDIITTRHKPETQKGKNKPIAAMPSAISQAINALLAAGTDHALTSIEEILEDLDKKGETIRELEGRLAKEAQRAKRAAALPPPVADASGLTPHYMTVNAKDIFTGPNGKTSPLLNFDITVIEWRDANGNAQLHPLCPEVDADFVFQPGQIAALAWAFEHNMRPYLHGHTGTGKTSLIEQYAALTGYIVHRVNFDSEITRMDLVGRETLISSNGVTVSKFVEGILPLAMTQPAILICDEVDFIRPDVAYVMQRALEGKGLLLTEDGGRLVTPHPMFRMAATANTRGQGDETGVYSGARVQSGAFLNRWAPFIEITYLPQAYEAELITKRVDGFDAKLADQLASFAFEARNAFFNGETMQVVTPRDLVTIASAIVHFSRVAPSVRDAIQLAFDIGIYGKCSRADATALSGIANRTVTG